MINNILITGGTGFVGYWLGQTWRRYLPFGYFNITFDNRKEYENGWWKNHEWNYIIHAANIAPTEVIKVAQRDNARVLYVSSGAVYHNSPNEYGLNKLRWEYEMKLSGVNYSSARLFACCGSHLKWQNFALGTFIKNALENKPLNIWGDGTMIRSYIYGFDLAEWFWKILYDGVSGESYDVGSIRAVSMLELARKVKEITNSHSEIIIENKHPFEQAPIYLPKNIEKTEDLGLKLKVDFDLAMEKSVKDYLDDNI